MFSACIDAALLFKEMIKMEKENLGDDGRDMLFFYSCSKTVFLLRFQTQKIECLWLLKKGTLVLAIVSCCVVFLTSFSFQF